MDCDFHEDGVSCKGLLYSIGFSDAMYYVFCTDHVPQVQIEILKWLNNNPDIHLEDDIMSYTGDGWEEIKQIHIQRMEEIAMKEVKTNQIQALFSVNDLLVRSYRGEVTAHIVKLGPVYAPDPNNINHAFWRATPTGMLEMQINNPAAFGFFETGRKYLVTFTTIEEE